MENSWLQQKSKITWRKRVKKQVLRKIFEFPNNDNNFHRAQLMGANFGSNF